MKYLILIYGNPESRAIWESFSDEQRAEGFAYYGADHRGARRVGRADRDRTR